MLLSWLRRRRRRRLMRRPFPSTWQPHLDALPCYTALGEPQRQRLRELVQVFLAEKDFEGCGGLEIDNAIRVGIAAQACLLILELDLDDYSGVRSILVYPSAFRNPMQTLRGDGSVGDDPHALAGEAWLHGEVILAWDRAFAGGRDPDDGHNPVFHEFAHKLDMLDGWADGEPPLAGRDRVLRWRSTFKQEYQDLVARHARGDATELDPYATTDPAEFFAVATEHFFERPRQLQRVRPSLYACLADFYRQDPSARAADAR